LSGNEFRKKADWLWWVCFERCGKEKISTIPFASVVFSEKEDGQSRANATAMKLNRLSSPQAK
jgi:hypothetical protein